MTIEEMKRRKMELGYSNEQLSVLSGVPLGTIMKVFGGATKAPRRSTIEALEKVLAPAANPHYQGDLRNAPHAESGKHIHGYEYDFERKEGTGTSMLREPSVQYGTIVRMTPGQVDSNYMQNPHRLYTIEDYYALPDDIRTELIDGVFYDMASPSVMHQLILGELYLQFKECERRHEGRCRVILSPCDVQLNQDRHTMLQPDLLVVCDREKIKGIHCYGAPDLVIEILSPSSRSHDCVLKLDKYKNSDVREYWIVDPDHRQVITYLFDEDNIRTFETYSFMDTIPIHISGGDCSVDMKDVAAGLE